MARPYSRRVQVLCRIAICGMCTGKDKIIAGPGDSDRAEELAIEHVTVTGHQVRVTDDRAIFISPKAVSACG